LAPLGKANVYQVPDRRTQGSNDFSSIVWAHVARLWTTQLWVRGQMVEPHIFYIQNQTPASRRLAKQILLPMSINKWLIFFQIW
jgi:hypothetical protein